jgi:hypothetical protein
MRAARVAGKAAIRITASGVRDIKIINGARQRILEHADERLAEITREGVNHFPYFKLDKIPKATGDIFVGLKLGRLLSLHFPLPKLIPVIRQYQINCEYHEYFGYIDYRHRRESLSHRTSFWTGASVAGGLILLATALSQFFDISPLHLKIGIGLGLGIISSGVPFAIWNSMKYEELQDQKNIFNAISRQVSPVQRSPHRIK